MGEAAPAERRSAVPPGDRQVGRRHLGVTYEAEAEASAVVGSKGETIAIFLLTLF